VVKVNKAWIDHIVIGSADLCHGTACLEKIMDVKFFKGGKHPLMLTHNNLLKLQEPTYMEVIAIDPETSKAQGEITRKRWFSLDEMDTQKTLNVSPTPLCWVVAVDDIEAVKSTCGYDPGVITKVARGELAWLLTIPDDGQLIESGVLPYFIQWPEASHPSQKMPDSGLKLEKIVLIHPNPDAIKKTLANISIDGPIEVREGETELTFQISAPNRETIELSSRQKIGG